MAVRFWPDGAYEYLDPVGVGVMSGGGVVYDDGERSEPWLDRPGQNRNELYANDALRWMSVPREEIMAIRPPVPQFLFPPTDMGSYMPLTIEDVLLNGDYWTPRQRAWISGPPRYLRERDLEQGMFSGTAREGGGVSVNPML
jgi:hypothetical protein